MAETIDIRELNERIERQSAFITNLTAGMDQVIVGQKHLVGEGAVLRRMIDSGRISSFILWGPPGVGKTTLAQIIANRLETPFYTLSAVTS